MLEDASQRDAPHGVDDRELPTPQPPHMALQFSDSVVWRVDDAPGFRDLRQGLCAVFGVYIPAIAHHESEEEDLHPIGGSLSAYV
jgi:hypothetical protein